MSYVRLLQEKHIPHPSTDIVKVRSPCVTNVNSKSPCKIRKFKQFVLKTTSFTRVTREKQLGLKDYKGYKKKAFSQEV